VGVAAWVKIFLINPYKAARHVINVVNPNADVEEKDESKDAIKTFGTAFINFFGFFGSCLAMSFLAIPIATLKLPYLVNLMLALSAVVLLVLSYFYFQNRD